MVTDKGVCFDCRLTIPDTVGSLFETILALSIEKYPSTAVFICSSVQSISLSVATHHFLLSYQSSNNHM